MLEGNQVITTQAGKVEPQQSELLTASDAAKCLGISKGHLYKLMMQKRIPYYKPFGKLAYFKRSELEQTAFNCRIATADELEQAAQSYCAKKGGIV